jgi:hypothetical protein
MNIDLQELEWRSLHMFNHNCGVHEGNEWGWEGDSFHTMKNAAATLSLGRE